MYTDRKNNNKNIINPAVKAERKNPNKACTKAISRADARSSCPFMKKCGGCSYAGMPYDEQLKKKEATVRRLLGDIAKSQKISIEPVVGADEPLYYRNKVHSVFARNKKGQIIRGMYREESHDVVPVSGCLLENRTADAIIEEVRRLLPSFKLKVFDEDTGYGWLRHVLVRVGNRKVSEEADSDASESDAGKSGCGLSEDIMLILVTAEVPFPGKNNFIKAIRSKFPQISTIIQNINNKRTSMVLGERSITIYGKGYIEDDSLGMRFRISPGAFFQINSAQTRRLYDLAQDMAGLTKKERVLDAYCGTGTIGMFMSRNAAEVTGVELNKAAVKDAIANARGNGISNIRFAAADATEYLRGLAAENCESHESNDIKQPERSNVKQDRKAVTDRERGEIDVLCMDPPRTGSTPEFIKAAADLKIPRIVYVSCNPETLARDLKLFIKQGYAVKRIVPVDMFPATDHCEVVVSLKRAVL